MTEHPVTVLSESLQSALRHGFESTEERRKNWKESKRRGEDVFETVKIAVQTQDVEVLGMFVQTWGSTCLGFDGIGAAAMTDSYTVVLRHNRRVAVCFGGTLAYCVDTPNLETFQNDLQQRNMASIIDARRYGKIIHPRRP